MRSPPVDPILENSGPMYERRLNNPRSAVHDGPPSPWPPRKRISLGQALALSVVCHLLLAFLVTLIPFSPSPDALAEVRRQPRERIEFSFVEPHDLPPDTSQTGPPPGAPSAAGKAPQFRQPATPAGPPGPPKEPRAVERGQPQEPSSAAPSEQESPAEATAGSVLDAGVRDPVPGPAQAHLERGRSSSLRRALREFQSPRSIEPGDPRAAGGGTRNVFVPDLSQIPQTGFGVGNLVFESRDFDWHDYARQIYWEILKAWYRRLWSTTDEFEKWSLGTRTWFLDHQTRVRFVIEKTGQVTGVEQEAGSGCPPLDRSAVEALEEVILPPLPEGFPRDQEVVHARFIAIGEVRGMRESLEAYRGWF